MKDGWPGLPPAFYRRAKKSDQPARRCTEIRADRRSVPAVSLGRVAEGHGVRYTEPLRYANELMGGNESALLQKRDQMRIESAAMVEQTRELLEDSLRLLDCED